MAPMDNPGIPWLPWITPESMDPMASTLTTKYLEVVALVPGEFICLQVMACGGLDGMKSSFMVAGIRPLDSAHRVPPTGFRPLGMEGDVQ